MGKFFRSLRVRLAIFFTLGVAAIVFVFLLATLYHLREELIEEKGAIEYADKPDYTLHGSFESDAEIHEIMHDLVIKTLIFAGPMFLVVILFGWLLAKRSLQPIADLNNQLSRIDAQNLQEPLSLFEADPDFEYHLDQLNLLLTRLAQSFDEIREYAAKVAHELRTPLTILRLKLENPGTQIQPEVREEIATELERLSRVVDQSLLIARAERGAIHWQNNPINLTKLLNGTVEDYRMLAHDDGRKFELDAADNVTVVSDPSYLKQILQSLLTNVLVHGTGTIGVTLAAFEKGASITIINGVSKSKNRHADTLGLGIRVIAALVSAQDQLKTRTTVDQSTYRVQIDIPTPG